MFNRIGRIAVALAGALDIAAGPAAAVITNAPPPPQPSRIKVESIAKGLEHPWGLQFLPDGRMLVTERPGRLRIVGKDGKLSKPIAGVPEVAAVGQGGLLDVLLAPDFAKTGTIYFSYGEPRGWFENGTSVARASS
jgi:glucose/arabinose dehydrogenase